MYGKIMGFISTYQIFGIIPLDLTLHFFIGMFWTIIGLKKGIAFKWIAIGLFSIALGKELNDYFFHYQTHWSEYASDFGITMLYLVVVFFVRKVKTKIDKSEQNSKKWKIY